MRFLRTIRPLGLPLGLPQYCARPPPAVYSALAPRLRGGFCLCAFGPLLVRQRIAAGRSLLPSHSRLSRRPAAWRRPPPGDPGAFPPLGAQVAKAAGPAHARPPPPRVPPDPRRVAEPTERDPSLDSQLPPGATWESRCIPPGTPLRSAPYWTPPQQSAQTKSMLRDLNSYLRFRVPQGKYNAGGWVPLSDACLAVGCDREELIAAIEELAPAGYYPAQMEGPFRQRFELDLIGLGRVRVMQGHGINVDINSLGHRYPPGPEDTYSIPPATRLWHATLPSHMPSIARRGLLAGGTRGETGAMQRGGDRQHVHTIPVFGPFPEWTLRAVQDSFHGRESPVILEIDIQRAIALGVTFVRNAGGVVLTRGIELEEGKWGLPPSCFNNFWALPGLMFQPSLLDRPAEPEPAAPPVRDPGASMPNTLPPGVQDSPMNYPPGHPMVDYRITRLFPLTWNPRWPKGDWVAHSRCQRALDHRAIADLKKQGISRISTDAYVQAWLKSRTIVRSGSTWQTSSRSGA